MSDFTNSFFLFIHNKEYFIITTATIKITRTTTTYWAGTLNRKVFLSMLILDTDKRKTP